MRSILSVLAITAGYLHAQGLIFHGKVLMADGTPPPKSALIERFCGTGRVSAITKSAADGSFVLKLSDFNPSQSLTATVRTGIWVIPCVLRAELSGYESSTIELDSVRPLGDPTLPPLVLQKREIGRRATSDTSSVNIPRRIQASWQRVAKEVSDSQWERAEARLREIVAVEPAFAPGWALLGVVTHKLGRPDDGRKHFQRAIEANRQWPEPRYLLLQSEANAGHWQAVRDLAGGLMRIDAGLQYRPVRLFDAVARFNLGDLDGAESSALDAVRLDSEHQMTRAEYVLGRIFETRADLRQAAAHYKRYLELTPNAPDAAAMRDRIAKLESGKPVDAAADLPAVHLDFSMPGEVWIPGGMRALARISHTQGNISPENFFADYCRALVRYNTPGHGYGISGYSASMRAYFATISELTRMSGRSGSIRVRLSLTPRHRKTTAQLLALFGWRVIDDSQGVRVELGDTAADGARQPIPAALGIDVIEMQEALNSGRDFEFEILSDRVRLFGGDAWLEMLRDARPLSGGLAEAFVNDSRLAKAYAGLSTLPNSTVELLMDALGARNIVSRYAGLLLQNAGSFEVVNGTMAVPGGASAGPAWEKFVGISPRNGAGFARALLNKDGGIAVMFYSALKQAAPDRQRVFTSAANLPIAYGWFTGAGIDRATALIRDLPLDSSGRVRLSDGVRAWTGTSAANGTLPDALTAEHVTAVAAIEHARGAALDEDSVASILRNYDEWRPIFPYFERIPGLGSPEFRALHAFTNVLRQQSLEQRNIALGAWYSIVELIAMAHTANSVETLAAQEAFRRACEPSPTPATLESALRLLVRDAPHVNESGIVALLAFDSRRDQDFRRILELQKVPSLEAALRSKDVARAIESLTGLIYAASFPSTGLLISEDRELVRKHRFATAEGPLFRGARLTSSPGGSRISGGFLDLASLARGLAAGSRLLPAQAGSETSQSSSGTTPGDEPAPRGTVFRADARLVIVPATVTDDRGRYVDDLTASDFQLFEDGQPRSPVAFEPLSSGVSCALLLDTTESMFPALPALKSAALHFIDNLRPVDSVAVYGFSDSVSLLQPFSSNKIAAKRTVLGTIAAGQTALYDALTRVSRDLSERAGKKVIVVFTDGEDNLSTLPATLAVQRSKTAGTPVYTIAQGQALGSEALLNQLSEVSHATGGLPFRVQRPADINTVFERISNDLAHGYLLTFQPAGEGTGQQWHKLQVIVQRDKRYGVRAREGYFSE